MSQDLAVRFLCLWERRACSTFMLMLWMWMFLLQGGGFGFMYLCCRRCSPSLSCVLSTWARRGLQTGQGGQELCMSLYCRNTIRRHIITRNRTSGICQSRENDWLPPPPFALLKRNGNVETFVIDVKKRPAEGNQGSKLVESASGQEACRLHFRACSKKRAGWQGDLLVVVDEETLHNENMVPLLLWVNLVSFWWQADAMGAGKLDWILLPASHGVDHRLHVYGGDHWQRRRGESRSAGFTTYATNTAHQCASTHISHSSVCLSHSLNRWLISYQTEEMCRKQKIHYCMVFLREIQSYHPTV